MVKLSNTGNLENKHANIILTGGAGAGKTYTLGTINSEELLIIDVVSESGLLTLKGKNIDTISVDSYADLLEAIEWIKENGSKYNVIAIDSLSQLQKQMEGEIPDGSNKFAKWKEIKDNTKHIVDEFKRLPFHVVFTCELTKEKDEETGGTYYLPSLVGSSKQDLEYWVDEVWFLTKRQAKLGEDMLYSCVTNADSKYPCKSRMGLPMVINNINLQDVLDEHFGKINKEEQIKELKDTVVAETTEKEYREKMIADIRELAKTKDFNPKEFKATFGAGLDDVDNSMLEKAQKWVEVQKDKEEGK
jgi:hypothetical protein